MVDELKTVTWGESTFTIHKLLAPEAKALFVNHVRPLMRGSIDVDNNADIWRQIIAAVSASEGSAHYHKISDTMLKSVVCNRGGEQRFLNSSGSIEWAFQGLEGAHMIMLDLRAFTVNFTGWLPVFQSEFPLLMSVIESLKVET